MVYDTPAVLAGGTAGSAGGGAAPVGMVPPAPVRGTPSALSKPQAMAAATTFIATKVFPAADSMGALVLGRDYEAATSGLPAL